jgi:adenylate cyclase
VTDAARKLATIVALDVAGYSARTEADEAKTTSEVAALRKVIEAIAARHGGRVFNTAGDGFMLEFGSSLAAVEAAFALAETCEPKVRVGVHLGDVVVQPNGDLLGHGVNVAARLMAQSLPGAALISGAVRSSIRGPLAERLQSRGHLKLDKMAETIEAFALGDASVASAKSESTRKVSVCVLAFSNISDDPQQEYFSDGISEDIITDLSKVSALGVTARNTSFQFKGKSVDVPTIARQLKVTHVLEGSVRKAAGRVRITAQLIDGASGEHVWAERYDRDLKDIFALQDEISEAIVKALKLRLLPEEKKAIEHRGTTNIDAYNLYLMARKLQARGHAMFRGGAIIRLCQAAIKTEPDYARAWALMALTQALAATFGKGAKDDGLVAADRALALDASSAEAHTAKARVLMNLNNFEAAGSQIENALRLDPESSEVNQWAGLIRFVQGRPDDALAHWMKAAAPADAGVWTLRMLAFIQSFYPDREALRHTSQRMLTAAQDLLAVEPENGMAMGAMAEGLVSLREIERARETVRFGMLLDPDNIVMTFSFARAMARVPDFDAALDILEHAVKTITRQYLSMFMLDPNMTAFREQPRFKALMAVAEARFAAERVAARESAAQHRADFH